MERRSQRLAKMPQNKDQDVPSIPTEKYSGGSTSDSDNDKTIVEQPNTNQVVAELKEEINALKLMLGNLMKTAESSQIETVVSPAADTYPLTCPIKEPTTSSGNYHSPLLSQYTSASRLPMQQKLSISDCQYNPNLHTSHSYATQMPQPLVHTTNYMPPTVSRSTAQPQNTSIPSTSLQTPHIVPPSCQSLYQTTTNQPQPYQQRPPTATVLNTYGAGASNSVYESPQDPHLNRPIRKLSDLPEFNGKPEQWPMFSVAYKETTRTYNYTKLENLSRLQKALRGDAKAKVEAYLIHPESVDEVMNTLEFHYGRPQIMIRSQLSKVRSFPAIKDTNITEIINLSTLVSNLTAFLENAGATMHLCNPTLLDQLLTKLPISKREEWMKYSLNSLGQYPSIRQFSEWLHITATYVALAIDTDMIKGDTALNKIGKVKQSFAITTSEIRHPNCHMCSENHKIYHCGKFKSAPTTERWKVVKDNRLCFGCLRAGHTSSSCNNRRQCRIGGCTKIHNRLLHEEQKTTNKTKSKPIIECVDNGTQPVVIDNTTSSPVTTIVDSSLNKKTLFKYLPVRLKGPTGYADIIAFIDDGSKISLLEDDIAKKIGLDGKKSTLTLGWIGGKRSSEMSMQLNLEIGIVDAHQPCFQIKT